MKQGIRHALKQSTRLNALPQIKEMALDGDGVLEHSITVVINRCNPTTKQSMKTSLQFSMAFSLSLAAATASLGQSVTDLWDVSQGTQVTGHSPLDIQEYDARDAFGGNFGSYFPEAGSIVFADESAPGAVDYLEWKTIAPVTLTGYTLYANGDGGDEGYREFASFTLKAKSVGSATFDITLDTFTPSHPYKFATFDRTIQSITAQEFRAEFVNSGDIISSYRGPRVVELDAVPEPEHAAIGAGAILLGFAIFRNRRSKR